MARMKEFSRAVEKKEDFQDRIENVSMKNVMKPEKIDTSESHRILLAGKYREHEEKFFSKRIKNFYTIINFKRITQSSFGKK